MAKNVPGSCRRKRLSLVDSLEQEDELLSGYDNGVEFVKGNGMKL
jgi:hypothetical protein